jgi:hypothetical protein
MIVARGVSNALHGRISDIQTKLDPENNLAELRAGFEIGVRGSGFGEREDAVDDGS